MEDINKHKPIEIVFMVLIGIALGQIQVIQNHASNLIMPFLMIMLYVIFLQIPMDDIKNSFKNKKFTICTLIINFIWTPIFVYILGNIFLQETPELFIGFIMLMVTPCIDWYLIFTGIAKGNVALGASILPLNFILQIIGLPIYLYFIGGSIININSGDLFNGVVIGLLIPLIIAQLSRKLIINKKRINFLTNKVVPKISNIQNICLNIAIICMFASKGKVLIENIGILSIIIIPMIIFFVFNLLLGQLVGNALEFSYEDTTALNMTVISRNSPLVLAIAVASLRQDSLTPMVLVLGPLIEIPMLACISRAILKIKREERIFNNRVKM